MSFENSFAISTNSYLQTWTMSFDNSFAISSNIYLLLEQRPLRIPLQSRQIYICKPEQCPFRIPLQSQQIYICPVNNVLAVSEIPLQLKTWQPALRHVKFPLQYRAECRSKMPRYLSRKVNADKILSKIKTFHKVEENEHFEQVEQENEQF